MNWLLIHSVSLQFEAFHTRASCSGPVEEVIYNSVVMLPQLSERLRCFDEHLLVYSDAFLKSAVSES